MKRKIISVLGLITVIPCLVAYYLSVSMPEQTPFFIKMIVISITVVIGTLGGVYLLRFMEMVAKLYEKLMNIANGDLAQEVKPAPESGTENLADSINKVTQKLRENANELEKRSILIERSAQEMKRRDEIRSTYLSTVAHELRAPLINIDKSTSFLLGEENIAREEKDNLVKIISTNAKRLIHMVNDLLDISRMESGEMVLRYDLVDLRDIIEEASGSVERWRKSKELQLVLKIAPDLPKVYVDRVRIVQVVINLLSNAIKFTPPHGKIIVECKTTEGLKNKDELFVLVEVDDNGTGFSEAIQELLFVRYKLQQELGSYRTVPNTGLGLPIAKQIIELHGGNIWAQSKTNSGSRFSFTLPVKAQVLGDSEIFTPGIAQKKILVIDDEKELRDLLTREFNKKGYLVDTAFDGFDGFKRAVKNEYDVVISDIRMPNMDGIECLKILKKMTPHTQIILMTGFSMGKKVQEIIDQNAYVCVQKPFDLPELLAIVEKASRRGNK
ncbi:MAG: response regulator [Candidatus Omnitrophota bacterium]